MNSVSLIDYEKMILFLCRKLNFDFDCIVCLKRSGFIVGAYISNKFNKPLFVPSEIKSIPCKYKKVLIVDDKVFSGKSINKVKNKVLKLEKKVTTACLLVQKDFYTDFWVNKSNGKIIKMWYEQQKQN